MDQTEERQCGSIGMKVSLLCALLGAVAPVAIMLKEFLLSLPGGLTAYSRLHPQDAQPKWPILIGIVVSLIGLGVAAALLGKLAGKIICRRKSKFAGAALVGICLAFSCIIAGILVASLVTLVVMPSLDSLAVIGIYSFATLVVGAIPAVLLGVLFGALVRWRLVKAGCCV